MIKLNKIIIMIFMINNNNSYNKFNKLFNNSCNNKIN